VHFVFKPHAAVLATIAPVESAMAFEHIIIELSFVIVVFILPLENPLASLGAHIKVPFVLCAIRPSLSSYSMLLVVFPLSSVGLACNFGQSTKSVGQPN
jgi:hypothetical protein